MSDFRYELIYRSKKSSARVGRIHTPHGVIETPHFVAVGTHGTLKSLDSLSVTQMGLQLMFCNTYHLMIHPGAETVARAGGLHSFMNRTLPLITDSGGFQVFSLAYGSVKDELKSKGQKKSSESVIRITEEGVLFRSYRDGQKLLLTPESSIQAQKLLGADIIIPLDELPPYHIDPKALVRSLARTHRWEERSLKEHLKNPKRQAIYGVLHGGLDLRLRTQSCQFLSQRPFDGFAIGGSLGKNRTEMITLLSALMPMVPEDKPRHLLGIGDLPSIHESIPLGIDTFDSSYPTRSARHGVLLTHQGSLKVLQSGYRDHFQPIESDCLCYTCQNYTVGYLHHLFKAHEFVGLTLASIHNVHFMVQLMKTYRERILQGDV